MKRRSTSRLSSVPKEMIAVMENGIALEVSSYFADMNIYRQIRATSQINDQSSVPIYHPKAATLSSPDSPTAFSQSAASDESTHSYGALSTGKKRRRTTLDDLLDGLEQGDAQSHNTLQFPSPQRASRGRCCAGDSSYASRTATGAEQSNIPYTVKCAGCTTRVLSCRPCTVLKGYVVAWAESVVTVQVESNADSFSKDISLSAQSSPSSTIVEAGGAGSGFYANCDGDEEGAEGEEHRQSIQLRLQRALGICARVRAITSRVATRSASSSSHLNLFASRSEKMAVSAKTNCGVPSVAKRLCAASRRTDNTRMLTLTLHSLHIVPKDAAQSRRPATFALQSILRPGFPTALECYPRHMIHFGILCHALWRLRAGTAPANAVFGSKMTSSKASSLCSSVSSPSTGAATATATSHTSVDAAMEEETMQLIPHSKSSDAVLVLGLGGNVLGQCLDAILPTDVPLDVVEVEPAVLAACVEHDCIPPLVSCFPEDSTPSEKSRFNISMATAAHPRGALYRFILGDAYAFLRDARPTLRSGGNRYSMIFLDCYDPDRERMMHEAGLIELCKARLQPGGCLLVNAHVLPDAHTMESQFMKHGFATVQALRVAGCDQCIVACILDDNISASSTSTSAPDYLKERLARFCVGNMRRMADFLNGGQVLRGGFQLDGEWLKRSWHVRPHASSSEMLQQRKARKAEHQRGGEDSVACDCRVWEHYS